MTPKQVRNKAYDSLQRSSCKVAKVGETKLLFYGCVKLDVKTEGPKKKEFPKDCRPTVKAYDTEKEALEAK